MHLQLGSYILENLQLLPDQVRQLLLAWPQDYLYGCISADITLGKKFTHYLQHCHSWRMARKDSDRRPDRPQRACAYGYLAHLAADTIAHSYFVPFKMMRTFNTVLLKHTYWEMRARSDRRSPEIWQLARLVARKDFRDNDALLRSVLSDTHLFLSHQQAPVQFPAAAQPPAAVAENAAFPQSRLQVDRCRRKTWTSISASPGKRW